MDNIPSTWVWISGMLDEKQEEEDGCCSCGGSGTHGLRRGKPPLLLTLLVRLLEMEVAPIFMILIFDSTLDTLSLLSFRGVYGGLSLDFATGSGQSLDRPIYIK